LSEAESQFRQLLSTSSSRDWRRISPSLQPSFANKGKARASSTPDVVDVVVHRKPGKAGDNVYRAVLEVSTSYDHVSLDSWRAVLSTPELRQVWDPAVESAHLVEMFDPVTRVSKTNFTLGWPAKYVLFPYALSTTSKMYTALETPSPFHVYSTIHPRL
jgi:hypothetical protein